MRTAVMIGSLGAFFNLYQLQALFPQLSHRFESTIADAGWLTMASLLGMTVVAPIAAIITRRTKPSAVLVTGFLTLGVLNALIAFTTSHAGLFFLRLVQGAALPFLLTATMTLVSGNPLRFVPLYVAGTILGSTLSRLYPAWSVDTLGWESGFLGAAGLMALAAAALNHLSRINVFAPGTGDLHPPSLGASVRFAMSDRTLLIAYLSGFALLFTQSTVFTALGLWLSQPPHAWTSERIGTLYLACLPALFFVLSAHVLRRRLSETTLASLLILLSWLALWVLATRNTSPYIGVGLFATATYVFQTITTRILSTSVSVPPSVATGYYLSFYYLGGAIGATLAGYSFSAWGWQGVLACLATLQALGLYLCIWLKHR
ncbi:MFS transporter [Marinobacter daepoensis]|uniref:MFS transporter n=1 Tax=Marinobacter daepoensis TaxID=262077 RepID=UPI00040A3058|nr:MFS transporter [Marinobacter daepoensis]